MINCLKAIWITQEEGSEQIFVAPSSKKEYFKDIDGELADANNEINDTSKNKLLLKRVEFLRKWTNSQKKKLDEAVKQQIHKNYLDSIYENAKKEGKTEEEAVDARRKVIEEFKKDSLKLDEVYYTFDTNIINWEKVARVVEGRLPIECQSLWMNNMRPSLNKNLWSETEKNKLIRLLKKYSNRNWIKISKELNNNRSPIQCMQEYLRYENKLKSDKEITQKIPYQILRPFKGKRNSKAPVKWTPEEDKKLNFAVKIYGERWNKVSILLPGRTDGQCRERYKNALDPQVNRNKIWSKEEILKLMELSEMYAPNWSRIAKELNTGRTNRQVKNQYDKLQKKRKRMIAKEAFYSKNIIIPQYTLPQKNTKYSPEEASKYGVKIAPAKPKPNLSYPFFPTFNGSLLPNPYSSPFYMPSHQPNLNVSSLSNTDLNNSNKDNNNTNSDSNKNNNNNNNH
ncbi:hypothetical protein BCR36DRAFT_342388, partial [Piromyces finnis]